MEIKKSRNWRSTTASSSRRWDTCSKVARRWSSCSHGWRCEQSAIPEMGRHFQGCDDHRGRDRSPGPRLRNFGTEHPELPHGTSQEESGRGLGVRSSKVTIHVFTNNHGAAARLRKKPGRRKRGKPKAGFPRFPPPLEIAHFPLFSQPRLLLVSQTTSGNLIVVDRIVTGENDRRECLTSDTMAGCAACEANKTPFSSWLSWGQHNLIYLGSKEQIFRLPLHNSEVRLIPRYALRLVRRIVVP